MNDEKNCPCEAVKELQKIVKEQDRRLADGDKLFAVINTKLNMLMAILGTVGVAVVGVVVKLAF